MLQNHVGKLRYPLKRGIRDVHLSDFEGISKLKIILPLIVVFFFVLGILFVQEIPKYKYIGTAIFSMLIILSIYYEYIQLKKMANEPIDQQKKYYEWGKVAESTQPQLEALQLIAFARYKDGFWTDTLENSPKEVRLKHIPNFRKKLDWLFISNLKREIAQWESSWGMNSEEAYNNLYNKLINGLHTPHFLQNYTTNANLKQHLLKLTNISEAYFDACFTEVNGKPKKLIWAWDLWRAILLSAAAFECGFINEEKAWKQIYNVSNISHYLFDNIEDFYTNIRLGHAFWCDDQEQITKRAANINAFLNPKKGTKRLVHNVPWTVSNKVNLTENIKNSFKNTF